MMTYVLLGRLFGGFLALTIFSLIVSKFAFRYDPPFHRASKTTLAAVSIPLFLSLIGKGFDPLFQIFYVIPAPLGWWLLYRHYRKHWQDDDISDVFS